MEGMWTLIAFTLFSQIAVAMVILQTVFGGEQAVENNKWKVLTLGIFALSFLASCLHISNYLASVLTITNIANSWLSREIIGVGSFGALLLLSYFMKNKLVLIAASLAGVFLVVTSSYLYDVPQIPFWEISKTLPLFTSIAFCAAATILFTLDILEIKENNGNNAQAFKNVLYSHNPLILIIAFACQIVCTHVHLLSAGENVNVSLLDTYSLISSLAIAGGLFYISRAMFKQVIEQSLNLIPCIHKSAIIMVVLVLVSALCNRILYFNEYIHFGM